MKLTFRLWPVLFCLLVLPASAQTFPTLSGRVVDNADLLPAADEAALNAELEAVERSSGNQVVVATIPSLGGRDIESYANLLFREWKLGRADQNDGVLFLVARDDRKTRIEVGYGLEGTLTDTMASVIIQRSVLPEFRAGRFDRGIITGTRSILDVLSGGDLPKPAPGSGRASGQSVEDWSNLIFLLVFLFLFVGPMITGKRGRPRGHRGPIFLPSPGGGGFGGSSRGGFGSGFGGGFSGGGGSSGGGGASGSW